jgi:hypothetical protein
MSMQTILKLPAGYQQLPATELLTIKLQMEERIDEIKDQIERVKSMTEKPTNGFGSKSWHQRAVKSRKAYARDIQRIQLELKTRKDTQKTGAPRLENNFVTIARRRLDETVFNDIMNEAREELQA